MGQKAYSEGVTVSKTVFYFIRHGQVVNAQKVIYERMKGFPLSLTGMRQVRETGRFLSSIDEAITASAIYASPLERTVQTAELIAEILNERRSLAILPKLRIRTDPRLIEAENSFKGCRLGYGSASFLKASNWKKFLDLKTPGWGEEYLKIENRMVSFVKSKMNSTKDEVILVVSHQSPIWVLRHFLTKSTTPLNPLMRKVDLASISKFCIDGATGKLLCSSYFNPAEKIR